jgi:anti-sigma B factor antagonist
MGIAMQDIHLEPVGPSGDCAVLQISGEIDLYSAPTVRQGVLELADKGAVHLIVDLTQVTFLDSTGLGVFVSCLKRLRAHDGSLALVINTEQILRIFRITGLTKVFPPHTSVSDAITNDDHWRHTAETEAGSVETWCQQHGLS